MKHILAILTLTFSLAVLAQVATGEKITAKQFNESMNHVGDIKQSLLTESQFQSLHGNCWVKLVGQNVSGSDYAAITGINTLPNTSGRFLRDIGGNAPALRAAQEDAFQGHRHSSTGYRSLNGDGGSKFASSSSSVNYSTLSVGNPISDGSNGTPRTANETRPKNIGVNFFIKINHHCE